MLNDSDLSQNTCLNIKAHILSPITITLFIMAINSFSQFIRTPQFWVNLGGMLLAAVVLVWLTAWTINVYTHHGESITVPELRGLTMENAQKLLYSKNLDFIVADSSFNKNMLPDAVIEQFPRPGAKVKEDRRIYLTVNARTAPMVGIPNIIYNSLENAIIQLESTGLSIGEKQYVPDVAKNAVLDIKLRGVSVEPGTKVPKGTAVDLVLGNGVGETMVDVPMVVGLTYSQARIAILGYQLSVGAMVKDSVITNLSNAIVFKQSPDPAQGQTQIPIGQAVDIWLRENPALKTGTPPPPPPVSREDSTPAEIKKAPAPKEGDVTD